MVSNKASGAGEVMAPLLSVSAQILAAASMLMHNAMLRSINIFIVYFMLVTLIIMLMCNLRVPQGLSFIKNQAHLSLTRALLKTLLMAYGAMRELIVVIVAVDVAVSLAQ
jgi:hypothetical protein